MLAMSVAGFSCDDASRRPAGDVAERGGGDPAGFTEFAGSKSCRACHEEAYQAWSQSHHALAERELVDELDPPAFRGHDPVLHGSVESRIREEEGALELVTLGGDGEVAPHAVVRAIGVSPLRQYLVSAPGGRLQTAALSYDPHRHEWFDVFGEEDRRPDEWGFWASRGMNWNSMCADCHNTDVRKGYDAETDTYDTRYVELGVGCESCHGPGRAHVDWQEAHPGGADDPTLPEMGLQTRPNAWVDTCGTCHARRGELHDVYRPTDSFLDAFLPELPGLHELYYADGQVLEEDYEYGSFLLSRMHHNGVTCVSCHDPHRARPREEGNKLCLTCHKGRLSEHLGPIDPATHTHHSVEGEGGQCVNCHMPLTTYMQRHPRRDHSFTVPDPQLTLELGIPNACNRCHEDQSPEWAAKWVDEWYGEKMERPQRRRARLVARARAGEAGVAADLVEWLRDEPYAAWRAVAASCLRNDTLDDSVRAALTEALGDESPLVRTSAVRALEEVSPLVPELQRCLDDPVRSVRVTAAWNLRSVVPLDSGAGRELMEYLEHNADQPLGLAMQAQLWLERGKPDRAAHMLRRTVEWDAHSGEFWRSLAVALSADGDDRQASEVLEKAVSRNSDDAVLWYSLGLSRSGAGDSEGGAEALRKSVEVDPRFARAWYNLGLALNGLGDGPGAIEAADRAANLEPNDPAMWYGLAAIARDQGDLRRARWSAEKALEVAPEFEPARQLLEWLRNR